MKQIIITVHGINTSGKWQKRIKEVLEPHFVCESIKYWHYRFWGIPDLFFDLWGILIIIAATIFWKNNSINSICWGIILGVGVIVSLALPFFRRYLALQSVQRQLGRISLKGNSPHLIAHSLGTYLTGICLENWPAVKFDRIILVGCVLDYQYDWLGLIAEKEGAFTQVRNEIAKKDIVTRAAFYIQGLVPGLGHAGYRGFKQLNNYPPNAYHEMASPNLPCAPCSAAHQSLLHNIPHPKLGHSQCFTDLRYVQDFWLPYLWDIDPFEFQEFVRICVELQALYDQRDYISITPKEKAFRERYWGWADANIVDFLHDHLRAMLDFYGDYLDSDEIADIVDISIQKIWEVVSLAKNIPLEDRYNKEAITRGLHPRIAVSKAVRETLEDEYENT